MPDLEIVEIYNAALFAPKWYKPWHTLFYIDCPQYISFRLFEQCGIRPFGMKKLDNPKIKYIGIYCRIKKSRLADFMKCMADLQRNMAICGYTDYEEFCRDMINDASEGED